MRWLPSRLTVAFWLDVTLLISVCALETIPFTGTLVHEWLGLAFSGLMVAHLLLSWNWIATETRRLICVASNRTRTNYFLNLGLFACITAVILSGVLISQEAIPTLTGKRAVLRVDSEWDLIHDRFSNFVVVLAAMHLATNWDLLVATGRRVLCRLRAGTL